MSVVNGQSLALWLCFIMLLTGCATTAEVNDRYARQNKLQRLEYQYDFPHVIYLKKGNNETSWHIYLEGDGKPWINADRISLDPTSARPLMLRLMTEDDAPSIYLGRPCYNLQKIHPECHPYFWTHGRYSKAVVDSLLSLLKEQISLHDIRKITLIGHSGGGTLSMLLAEKIPEVTAIMTLAGNLDIDAWADRHGYSRLQGSLNPAARDSLPSSIRQYHYLGKRDQNITLGMIQPVIKKQENAKIIQFDDYDHDCCWERDWPDLLLKL